MIVVLVIEPFYGGSHRQLIDFLLRHFSSDHLSFRIYTLPAKKWHWRARTSALHFHQTIPVISADENESYLLFCSSVLNLSELMALRPDLNALCARKFVYFHENQLAYPVQKGSAKGDRDFQFGYNEILTALVADVVLFNSAFNRDSFFHGVGPFFKLQPDHRPSTSTLVDRIAAKSVVLPFPVDIDGFVVPKNERPAGSLLHLVWPHRWEHDKRPDVFFECLFRLQDELGKGRFKVSVLGERFSEVPPIFEEVERRLEKEIVHFGRLDSREAYLKVLSEADVVVSTADHEFFGVAMVEGAMLGCFPIAPDRLSYPEIFTNGENRYRTDKQLFKILRNFCQRPHLPRQKWDPSSFREKLSHCRFIELFQCLIDNQESVGRQSAAIK